MFSTFLNTKIARNLEAQTILVGAADKGSDQEIAEQLDMFPTGKERPKAVSVNYKKVAGIEDTGHFLGLIGRDSCSCGRPN